MLISCPLVGSIWSCLHVLHLINHNRVDDAAEQQTAGDGVETLQQQYQRTNNQYQVESPPPSPRLVLVRNQSKPSNTNATTNTSFNVVLHTGKLLLIDRQILCCQGIIYGLLILGSVPRDTSSGRGWRK